MNGSNHINENKGKPLEMCPVCIRKLHENVKFDMLERYNALAKACKATNSDVFKKDGDWYSKVADSLTEAYGKNYLHKNSMEEKEEKR